MKILSIHDLQIIRKRAEHHLSLREESNEKVTEKCYGLASGAQHLQILICGGTGCKASSSQGITDNLLKAIQKNEITDKVEVITVGCFGFCEKGPIVKIIPDNTFYTQVTPEDAEEIINEHIIGGRRIERLLYVDPKTEHTVSDSKHYPVQTAWQAGGERASQSATTPPNSPESISAEWRRIRARAPAFLPRSYSL